MKKIFITTALIIGFFISNTLAQVETRDTVIRLKNTRIEFKDTVIQLTNTKVEFKDSIIRLDIPYVEIKDSLPVMDLTFALAIEDSKLKVIRVKSEKDSSSCTSNSKKRSYKAFKNADIYLGVGFMAGPPEHTDYEVIYGSSCNFQLGFKHYFKFGKVYAIGYGLEYQYNSYRIRNGWAKDQLPFIPETISSAGEYYRTNQLNLAFLNRVYFCRDIYLEFGVFGDWVAGKEYKTKYTLENASFSNVYKSNYFFNSFAAEAYASIGLFDCVSIFGRYRFTNLFNQKRMTGELPRWSIGVLWMF